jgi:Methyltransferase domain
MTTTRAITSGGSVSGTDIDPSADARLVETVTNCPYCGSPEQRVVVRKRLLAIVRCPACALHYTTPRWNEAGLTRYYSGPEYFTGQAPGAYRLYQAEEEEKLLDFDRKYRVLATLHPPGTSLLDVGCATGISLRAASANGFIPEGVELSTWASSRNATAFPIADGNLMDLETRRTYHAISMWDVVEHLLDPCRAFRKLNELLQLGGLLALTYPDPTSWLARMMGSRWWVFVPEEHYFFFPGRVLDAWLGQAGFTKIYERRETRCVSLRKLAQKTAPFSEPVLNVTGLGRKVISVTIPYKTIAIFRKTSW